MNETKHTPLRVVRDDGLVLIVDDRDEYEVAQMLEHIGTDEEGLTELAAFIVKACNNHKALLDVAGLAFTLASMVTSPYTDMIQQNRLGNRILNLLTKLRESA